MTDLVPELPSTKNTAVFLVDMQTKEVADLSKKQQRRIIPNIKNVLAFCAHHDVLVVHAQWENRGTCVPELQETLKEIPRSIEIVRGGHRVIKNARTDLDAHMRAVGIAHVFVMGVHMAGCVADNIDELSRLPWYRAHFAWDTMANAADKSRLHPRWPQRVRNLRRYAQEHLHAFDFFESLGAS